MSSASAIQTLEERGSFSGLRNLLRKENDQWWRTRKWWAQSLVWFVVINGLVVLIMWIIPAVDPAGSTVSTDILQPFMSIFSAFTTFGAMILMQSSIVEEKRSGTAAWIMTNPVSRTSFILSKLIANVIGIFTIVIGLQSLLAYLLISAKGGLPHGALPFFTAIGLNALHVLFFITLALMLGSFFNSRGPVIGLSIGILIGQDLIGQLVAPKAPWFPAFLPMRLADYAVPVAMRQTVDPWPAILTTSILSLLFVLVAIWRFRREEF
jgi:ABC-type transport system involved in multi-copper enzyme maturation permease subunit